MTTLIKQQQTTKLGFKKKETTLLVFKLNTVLSTYQVFFHKLQNFHWNIVGSDFFDVHEITQGLYEKGLKNIDDVAERIRVLGQFPTITMAEYEKHSIISESSYDKTAEMMFHALIADLEKLVETFLDVHEQATKIGDIGTVHMAGAYVKELETSHWQLSAWTKQKPH